MKKTTFTPEQIELLYMLSELIEFTEKHGYPIAETLKEEKEYFKHAFNEHAAIHHADTILEDHRLCRIASTKKLNEDSDNKFFYVDVDALFFPSRTILQK